MSATPDSTLEDPEQTIAVLRRERDEALARETALAEVLQVINSSPGDLKPVFDAMLEKAARLCEAPFGVLRTWDGGRFHLAAAHGDPKFIEWAWDRGSFAPADDGAHFAKGQLLRALRPKSSPVGAFARSPWGVWSVRRTLRT